MHEGPFVWITPCRCPSPPTSRCFTATPVVTLHTEETDEPEGLSWRVAGACCGKAEETAEEKMATALQTGAQITVNPGQGDDQQKARNLNDNGETESFYAIIPRVLIGEKDEFTTDGAGHEHSHWKGARRLSRGGCCRTAQSRDFYLGFAWQVASPISRLRKIQCLSQKDTKSSFEIIPSVISCPSHVEAESVCYSGQWIKCGRTPDAFQAVL